MAATSDEINHSRMLCILKEMQTRRHVDPNSREWTGYHPEAYNVPVRAGTLDALASTLCVNFKALPVSYIKNMSLEAQLWWRDHQAHDREQGR